MADLNNFIHKINVQIFFPIEDQKLQKIKMVKGYYLSVSFSYGCEDV